MAKRMLRLTLQDIEGKMGYRAFETESEDVAHRFYSDLGPVSKNLFDRTKKEYSEFARRRLAGAHEEFSAEILPRVGKEITINVAGDRVVIRQQQSDHIFRFTVDIYITPSIYIPLILNDLEAYQVASTAQFCSSPPQDSVSPFFRLPLEIRHKIYKFAIPREKWSIRDIDGFERKNLPRGIGDPSGFYYPFRQNLGILLVNKQTRIEALPLAYQQAHFQLEDVDDVVKFLIAVGRKGRDNIESLEFSWESKAASRDKQEAESADDDSLIMPVLHASTCILLLKGCRRVQRLRLYLDDDIVEQFSVHAFMADPGIKALCSVRGIAKVEVWSLLNGPLEQYEIAKFLRDMMESPNRHFESMREH